eukprot:m.18466 g.18466  ORF g.18466 m.18466 type:complete len:272 (+) comp10078_c0_seq2:122-937(+)
MQAEENCFFRFATGNKNLMLRLARASQLLGSARRSIWLPAVQPLNEKEALPSVTVQEKQGKYFLVDAGSDPVSPWHDLPYRADTGQDAFTFVCEIPKNTKAKMEINKDQPHNPIVQDVKKGAPRFYHEAIPWNYGCIPQTHEDPRRPDHLTGIKGDNDPVDVVEIGDQPLAIGQSVHLKVLGALALLDEGETDWKIIAINRNDPRAADLRNVSDIPGIVDHIRTWFRDYKIPDGKPPNEFAFKGKPVLPAAAISVVDTAHEHWRKLFRGSQ